MPKKQPERPFLKVVIEALRDAGIEVAQTRDGGLLTVPVTAKGEKAN